MELFSTAFLSGLASTLAAGIISNTGGWARRKLGTPERQKALERCSQAGFEALVRDGIDREAETGELKGHGQEVVEAFFRLTGPQHKLKDLLRGKEVTGADLAELFEEEQAAEQLPQLEPEQGFKAFLDAFEDRAVEEEALREVIDTGHGVEQTRLIRKLLAVQENQAQVVKDLPEDIARAKQEGRRREEAEKATEAEKAYLETMRREWRLLPLAALGGEKGPKEEVTLDDVYVELDTTTRTPDTENRQVPADEASESEDWPIHRSVQLSAREATAGCDRLVLLGDPGAGKSTFVSELLARFASARLGQGEVPEGFEEPLVPVLLVLRDLSSRLGGLELENLKPRERERALARAVQEEARATLDRYGLKRFEKGLLKAWEEGGCLVALDGLDEVPPARRPLVREAVLAACREGGGPGRVIVTCRVRSYGGNARLPGFEAFTLAPFDEKKVRLFCSGWYRAQSEDREKAEDRGQDLARAALAEPLHELASNPMLLTTMALVYQRNVTLPDQRVELYDEAIKVLLVRWQKEKESPEGLEEFLTDERKLRRMMERLAFEAHQVGGTEEEEAAGLPRGALITLLEAPEFLGDPGTAGRLLDYVDRRAGLLVGHGGGEGEHPVSYSFPHRTFQEYLAGCHLVRGWGPQVKKEYFARAGEGDLWTVAAELGAEALLFVQDQRARLLDLAYGLCSPMESSSEQVKRALLWSAKAAVIVGREAIEEETEGPEAGAVYLKRLIPRLVELLERDLPPVERAEAGRALAKLGDPRRGVTTCLGMEMCRVPAGEFWWGGGFDYHQDEKTLLQKRALEDPYWISRFPVTQAQFREFV